MKKIAFICLLVLSLAAQEKIELAIISKIAHALVKKPVILIYTDSQKYLIKKKYDGLRFIHQCQNADMALLRHFHKRCSHKKVIVLDFWLLKKDKDALGAFYWQKGRPNVIFPQSRLEQRKISLPKEFESFIDDTL